MLRALLWMFFTFVVSPTVAQMNSAVLTRPPAISQEARLILSRVVIHDWLDRPLCKKAFRERFRIDPSEDILDERYSIGIEPGLLPLGPMARGATFCEASDRNMILSGFWVNLSDIEDTAETILHEYFHLLQCQNDPPVPDEEPMMSKRMEVMEKEAYVVTAICMGENPKHVIQQYNFTPKGFEKWDM